MERSRVKELFGFRYIVNKKKMQVHRVKNLKTNCRVDKITNGGYCTKLWRCS